MRNERLITSNRSGRRKSLNLPGSCILRPIADNAPGGWIGGWNTCNQRYLNPTTVPTATNLDAPSGTTQTINIQLGLLNKIPKIINRYDVYLNMSMKGSDTFTPNIIVRGVTSVLNISSAQAWNRTRFNGLWSFKDFLCVPGDYTTGPVLSFSVDPSNSKDVYIYSVYVELFGI